MSNPLTNFIKKTFSGKYIEKEFAGHAIYLRKNNVDVQVYEYVFNAQYHRPYIPLKESKPVILDLGVNIGLSVIDFKELYPSAIIYGYELNSENAALALKNTTGFENVFIQNLGVWYSETEVAISGDDPDAYKINENTGQAQTLVKTTTLQQIIKDHHLTVIDYVKMDIEGAEHEIFQYDLDWLDITRQIKIEIHDGPAILEFIWEKLANRGFAVVKDVNHWSTIIGYKE